MNRLPVAKRKAALALQLPQWSPYADSGYAITWKNGFASVWCWDRQRIDSEIQKNGKTPKSQKKIPETMLRAPLENGLRLLKCLDGVEGQYWQDGQLVASRWWPQKPDDHGWLAFQRDCGVPADAQQTAKTVQDLPLLAQTWGKIALPGGSADDISIAETAFYGVMALGLGVTTVVLGLQHHQIAHAIDLRANELATIKKKAGDVFSARESAMNTLARIKSIDAIEPFPQPLVLMEALAESLPKDEGVFVREWDMTGAHLKVTISSPGANIVGANYVQALEKTGRFTDIQIVTDVDPKTTSFSMTIPPLDSAKPDELSQ